MYYSTNCSSSVGQITLGSDGGKLAGLWMEEQKYFGGTVPGVMTQSDGLPVFAASKEWPDRHFAGKKPAISDLPLAPISINR